MLLHSCERSHEFWHRICLPLYDAEDQTYEHAACVASQGRPEAYWYLVRVEVLFPVLLLLPFISNLLRPSLSLALPRSLPLPRQGVVLTYFLSLLVDSQ